MNRIAMIKNLRSRTLLVVLALTIAAAAAEPDALTKRIPFDGTPDQAYNAVYLAVNDSWQLRNANAKLHTVRFLDSGPDRASYDMGAHVVTGEDGKTAIEYILAPGKAAPSAADLESNANAFMKIVRRFKSKPIDPFVASHGAKETNDVYEFLARDYDARNVYNATRQIAQSQGSIEGSQQEDAMVVFRKESEGGKGGNLICMVQLVDQGNHEIRARMRFRSADGGRVYLSDFTAQVAKRFFEAMRSALVPMTQNPADSPYKRE